MLVLKKYIFISIFLLASTFGIFATPTSFLPMEDEMSTMRHPIYGASVDAIKPHRQPIVAETSSPVSLFTSKDILIGIALLGIYFVFIRKRSKSRCAGL